MPKKSSKKSPIFKENFLSELPEDLQEKIMNMSNKITFFDIPVTYDVFFKENRLFKYGNDDSIEIILTGKSGMGVSLIVKRKDNIYYIYFLNNETRDLKKDYLIYYDKETKTYPNDIITSFKIKNYHSQKVLMEFDRKTMETENDTRLFIKGSSGGRKASVKKEVCGKLRCIYKIAGSRKEHIKYKGQLIAVADYKKLMMKA